MSDYDEITPSRSMFWLAVKWIAFGVALVAVLRFLILPLFVADKVIGRQVQKFDAETSAQVYDNSRQFQQGTNRDLARYCREYHAATGAAKTAIATLIQDTASTYQGALTDANAACISETAR